MYFSSPAYSEPPCCLLSVSNLHSEGRWSGGVLGNSCTHVPACSSSDRARKEGHMINCLPPGTSEHSHHDVGKNGNCSLSPSLHQFRTRVGRDMLSFVLHPPPSFNRTERSAWGDIRRDNDDDNWRTAGSMETLGDKVHVKPARIDPSVTISRPFFVSQIC